MAREEILIKTKRVVVNSSFVRRRSYSFYTVLLQDPRDNRTILGEMSGLVCLSHADRGDPCTSDTHRVSCVRGSNVGIARVPYLFRRPAPSPASASWEAQPLRPWAKATGRGSALGGRSHGTY